MAQSSEQGAGQSPAADKDNKLEGVAAQEKNLAIFKTLSSWLSPAVLRGYVLSYFVRPEHNKTDQRKLLADALKPETVEIADGMQHALKSKAGTVIGMQCYKTGSCVLFRDCIVYPVLFLKYVGSGQKDYIIFWTQDATALDNGALRNLQRLSNDCNFVRLKVEVFISEAQHSSGDDLPAENLDALEKTASELLKPSATSAGKDDAPDSPQKELDETPVKRKKQAAKRSRRTSRKEAQKDEESPEEASPPHKQHMAREVALVEQQLRVQGGKSTKEMHDLHMEVKRGLERIAEAIEGLGDVICARPAAASTMAAYGPFAQPAMPPAPSYAAPAPPAPAAADTHHHRHMSERRTASPHRGASDDELDEMFRLFKKKMKQRDQTARREASHD